MATNDSRRLPVLSTGGAVHVSYTESDVKSITVNGSERAEPDEHGNINIVVPESVEVTDTVDMGEQDAVPTGAAVAVAIEDAVSEERERRLSADRTLANEIEDEARARAEAISAEALARRQAIDTAVGLETSARSAAVAGLDSRKLDKSALVVISQSDYNALAVKDANTFYFIPE